MDAVKHLLYFFSILTLLFMSSKVVANSSDFISQTIPVDGVNRKYLIAGNVTQKKNHKVLCVFLHGLTQEQNLDEHSLHQFREMQIKGEKFDCLFVFPIGLQGIFPKEENSFAWWPDAEKKNLKFITLLLAKIKADFQIKKCVLAGFSNGAYFVSNYLQNNELAFDGFWMQGGGEKLSDCHQKSSQGIVLEVGVDDNWHLNSVKKLQKTLIECGLGDKLLYRELPCDHKFDLQHFDENWKFLIQTFL